MECQVSYLTKKSRGGYARRDVDVAAEILTIGRGADAGVYLPDPRIPIHCAELHSQPGGLFIESVGPLDVRVNGAPTRAAKVKPGDKIAIGPYEFELLEPPEGKDAALSVELVRPLGDDFAEFTARSRLALDHTWLTKRRASWFLFLVVAGLFLALPLAAYFTPGLHQKAAKEWPVQPDQSWLSGEISGPHKFFADDCMACHRKPFEQVTDGACLQCHRGIPHHAKAERFLQVSEAGLPACQKCHKEHNGIQAIVLNDQGFCAGCHADLEQRLADSSVLNASDFARDHPQFRPTVMVDHATQTTARVSLDDKERLVEKGGVRFPHDKHLLQQACVDANQGDEAALRQKCWLRSPTGPRLLDCNSCHVPEPGRIGMLPVDQETHCQECHQLFFEPSRPKRALPHGKPKEVQEILADFYRAVALEGGFEDRNAPPSVRRRPGTELAPDARQEALAWAEEQARQATTAAFGKSICGYCHLVDQAADGTWDVVRPKLVDNWFTKGTFDHGEHTTMQCTDCHDAVASDSSSDVLIPGIANCRECHGGDRAASKVPSTCIMCHEFHLEQFGPMHPGTGSTAMVGK